MKSTSARKIHAYIGGILFSLLACRTAFATVRILSIKVAPRAGHLEMQVSTTAPVKPSLEAGSRKWILKVPGTVLVSERPIAVGRGSVIRVRPGQHPWASWIVVDLKSRIPFHRPVVGTRGFRLDLGLLGGESKAPASERPAPPSKPRPVPAESAGAPNSDLSLANAGLTYRVVDIALQDGQDRTKVIISADGPVRFKPARLDDGKLVSLSFLNSSLAWAPGNKTLQSASIRKVEARQEARGGLSQVTVDLFLNGPLRFSINRVQNQIVVSVDHPVAGQETSAQKEGNLNAKLSLDVENADLVTVLDTLAEQAGFETFFTDSIQALTPPKSLVTMRIENQPLRNIFAKILAAQQMSYDVQGNMIYFGTTGEIAAEKDLLPKETRTYTPRYFNDVKVFTSRLLMQIKAEDPVMGATASQMVQADPDPSQQDVVLVATRSDMAKLMDYISQIDVPPSGEAGSDEGDSGGLDRTQVFYLRYADPNDLRAEVQQVMTPPGGQLMGVVGVDPRTRSFIITAKPQWLRKVSELLKRLDIQLPQVSIQAKIVEVDATVANSLGVNWTAQSADANANPKVTAQMNAGPGANGFSNMTVATLQNNLNINASIQALTQEQKAQVLSSPTIMTTDKQSATISTTDQVTYPITNITTSNGGNVITNSFGQLSIPITLNVTPTIDQKNNDVIMIVNFTVSSNEGQTVANAPPNISTQQAQSTVKIGNGETAVLGGLMRDSWTQNQEKIPVLGDIPLLGNLFKSTSITKNKKELIILLTPTIVQN